jgi:hypothetical protein
MLDHFFNFDNPKPIHTEKGQVNKLKVEQFCVKPMEFPSSIYGDFNF